VRRGFFCPLALAVAGWVAAAPTRKAPADPDYYPTAVGTKWVYDENGRELIWEVTAAEAKGNETRVTISQSIAGGKPEPFVKATVSAKGVYQTQIGPFQIDPVCELRLPVKAGDSWVVDIPSQKGGLQGNTGTVTVGEVEDVEVPAGKFRALRIDVVITAEDGKPLAAPRRATRWYAPGVGLIKVTAGKDLTRALKAFTPAEK
jgi:hypothetical protein